MPVEFLPLGVTTLLATRHGTVRSAVTAVVEARGYSVADVLVTDAREDNQYGLPPGLVDELADGVAETGVDRVVVDGLLHPGQHYDLAAALPSVELLDRRDLYYAHLADGGNEAADIARPLRRTRLELRAAERHQREEATDGPSGESGRVADRERARDQLVADLEACQARQRRQVLESYEGVDAHVVVVGPLDIATTEAWAALTGDQAEDAVLRPATPRTTVIDVGPHEVAVSDTPGIVASQPEWYTVAVPGTMAALERADVVVVVEDDHSLDIDATVLRTQPAADGALEEWRNRLTTELQDALPTTRLAITLPYGAESLVSTLYDETTVESIEYGDKIEATVAVPARRAESIERRVEEAGGSVDDSG
jgi:50S ribosomal subunit-associated GTPase HflX